MNRQPDDPGPVVRGKVPNDLRPISIVLVVLAVFFIFALLLTGG